jgi:hypothetical protein
MSAASDAVTAFLKDWKPIAEMPPGNPLRRGMLRYVAAPDAAARRTLLAKTSELFALHQIYQELGIFREDEPPYAKDLDALLSLSIEDFAEGVREGNIRPFAETLQKGFQFGRYAVDTKHLAMRRFLLHLFQQEAGGAGMKYTVYANGIIHGSHGKTHEEMAKEFTILGFGNGKPEFGGQFYRVALLSFRFDTGSTTYMANVDPRKVIETVRRWLRLTGGQEDKVELAYLKR